jgi:hypothetical protein
VTSPPRKRWESGANLSQAPAARNRIGWRRALALHLGESQTGIIRTFALHLGSITNRVEQGFSPALSIESVGGL